MWIAVTIDGERVKTAAGQYIIRYDKLPGAVYYNPSRAKLDDNAEPETLPAGFEADSREGQIVRYCCSDEAKKDWAWLDGWKRRKNTSLAHAGCGESPWPQVPPTIPLSCPRCGVLSADETVYAQYFLASKVEGEGIKACVLEAWLTGKHHEYIAGKRPSAAPAVGGRAGVANHEESPDMGVEPSAAKRGRWAGAATVAVILVLVVVATVAAVTQLARRAGTVHCGRERVSRGAPLKIFLVVWSADRGPGSGGNAPRRNEEYESQEQASATTRPWRWAFVVAFRCRTASALTAAMVP